VVVVMVAIASEWVCTLVSVVTSMITKKVALATHTHARHAHAHMLARARAHTHTHTQALARAAHTHTHTHARAHTHTTRAAHFDMPMCSNTSCTECANGERIIFDDSPSNECT
jgi:hypothetical protein